MYAMLKNLDKLAGLPSLLTLLVLIGCVSCQKRTPMSEYYFPVDNLIDNGQVYIYSSTNDAPLADEVWYYTAVVGQGSKYLIGQNYGEQWQVKQLVVEKQTELGMITDSLRLFSLDSSGQSLASQVKISNRATFPFYRNEADTLLFKTTWTDALTGLQYTLDRKRIFRGDTTYNYNGESIPSVYFDLIEDLETFYDHDGATNSRWTGREVYAKGIGLVYFSKTISDFNRSYQLSSIMAGDEFFTRIGLNN